MPSESRWQIGRASSKTLSWSSWISSTLLCRMDCRQLDGLCKSACADSAPSARTCRFVPHCQASQVSCQVPSQCQHFLSSHNICLLAERPDNESSASVNVYETTARLPQSTSDICDPGLPNNKQNNCFRRSSFTSTQEGTWIAWFDAALQLPLQVTIGRAQPPQKRHMPS